MKICGKGIVYMVKNNGFRIFGIKINIDKSFWIIVVLLLWSFLGGFGKIPDISPVIQWTFSLLTVFLFFFSVLFHEFCHCFVGNLCGIRMKEITLLIFGGAAHIDSEKFYQQGAGAEFKMAIAGPISSLFLGGLFFGLLMLLDPFLPPYPIYSKFAVWGLYLPLRAMLSTMVYLNIVLGFFNIIPLFPMDGGRILRSFLWWSKGDLVAATKIAFGIGVLTAFVGFPFLGIFIFKSWFSLLWLMMIAFLVLIPAGRGELNAIIELRKQGKA